MFVEDDHSYRITLYLFFNHLGPIGMSRGYKTYYSSEQKLTHSIT